MMKTNTNRETLYLTKFITLQNQSTASVIEILYRSSLIDGHKTTLASRKILKVLKRKERNPTKCTQKTIPMWFENK